MPETGARNDPFPAFRFTVRFDDLPPGGFSDCTGLQVETEVQDYNEGGLNTFAHKFATRTKQSNITLKRGIVNRTLWNWYYDLTQGRMRFRNGTIVVHDAAGIEATMEFQIRQAFPVKWIGPDLNAAQSSIAVETLELAHHGLNWVR
jgi:phage tail-like protein